MPMIYRDYPTAFANVQDAYGLADNTPMSTKDARASSAPSASQTQPQSSSSSSFSLSRILRGKKHASRSPESTPTDSRRASVDSQRTLATDPVATSKASPPDYEKAFGALSSSYGLAGSSIVSVPVLSKHSPSSPSSSKRQKVDNEPRRAALAAWSQVHR